MNIGIDIGHYKTTIASSSSNGSIIFDELSYRSFKTIIDQSVPRKYGNHVNDPMVLTYNHRSYNFITKFDVAHYSFLKYCVKLADGCSSISVAVPLCADMEYREKLADLFMSLGLRIHIMTDIIGAGFLFAIKFERAQNMQKFAVIDLGHMKTSFALFSRVDNKVYADYVMCREIGALNFDTLIMQYLIEKYKIEDKILAEKVRLKLEKTKSSLNGIQKCRITIDDKGNQIHYELTQDEYLRCIQSVLVELRAFFEECKLKMGNIDQPVQLIGGNRFNVFVAELMKDFNVNLEMNAGESVAIGVALSGAIRRFGSKNDLELYDVTPDEIYVSVSSNGNDVSKENLEISESKDNKEFKGTQESKDNNESKDTKESKDNKESKGCKSTLGLDRFTKIPSPTFKIALKKKEDFTVDFVTDNKVIKSISVTDITGTVDIEYEINSLGRLIVKASNCKYSVSKFNFDSTIEQERKIALEEDNFIKVGDMRNELENAFARLPLHVFNQEQLEIIESANKDILFASMSKTIEQESEFRQNIVDKISFIEDLIKEKLLAAKNEIENKTKEAKNLLDSNKDVYIPSVYTLRGMIYNSEKMFKNIKTDIFGFIDFMELSVETFIENFGNLIKTTEEGIKKKIIEKENEKLKKEKEEEEAKNKKNENDKNEANIKETEDQKNTKKQDEKREKPSKETEQVNNTEGANDTEEIKTESAEDL